MRFFSIHIIYQVTKKGSSHNLDWTLYMPLCSVRWGMHEHDNLNFKPNNLVPPHYNLIRNMKFLTFSFRWATVFLQPLTSRWSNITSSSVFSFLVLKSSYTLLWIPLDCKIFIVHVTFFFQFYLSFLDFLFCCCSSVYFLLL